MSTVSSFPVPPPLHSRWGERLSSSPVLPTPCSPTEDQTQSTYEKVCFDYPLMLYSYVKQNTGTAPWVHYVFATSDDADGPCVRACVQGRFPTWRTPATSDSAPGTSAFAAGRSSTHKRTRGTSSPPSAPSPPSTPTSSSPSSTAPDTRRSAPTYVTPLRLVQRVSALVCSIHSRINLVHTLHVKVILLSVRQKRAGQTWGRART